MTENERLISVVDHVRQIVPAIGWRALFAYRRDSGKVNLQAVPLAAFALVDIAVQTVSGRDTDERYPGAIVGVMQAEPGHLDFCVGRDREPICYLAPGEAAEQYRHLVEEETP